MEVDESLVEGEGEGEEEEPKLLLDDSRIRSWQEDTALDLTRPTSTNDMSSRHTTPSIP